jgi:hypothetical protein
MKASRVDNLSPRPTRWVGLLAIAVLSFSASACIAQTTTSDGDGTGTTDDHKASGPSATEGTSATSGGRNNPKEPPVGPVFGPIPSPWLPPAANADPSASDTTPGNGVGGPIQQPVPSPWMSPGSPPPSSGP